MEKLGVAFLVLIIIVIVVGIVKSIGRGVGYASADRQYAKKVEESNGLEKIRLLLRKDVTGFMIGLEV